MGNYLYNGHELPVLPEWLRSKYPHAVISVTESDDGTSYKLFALDQMGYWGAVAWYADGEFVETYQGLILSDVYDPAAGQMEQFATCQWTYDPAGDTWALRFSDKYETCIGISRSFAEIGVTFRVIWSNTEILDANGELYLAASEPVEVTDPTEPKQIDLMDFLLGYIVELARPRMPFPMDIKYSYNGLGALPNLPKWDRKKYPYAVLVEDGLGPTLTPYLYVSSVPFSRMLNDSKEQLYATGDGNSIAYAIDGTSSDDLYDNYGEWYRDEAQDVSFLEGYKVYEHGYPSPRRVVWANYDVLDHDDGTVFLPASVPKPIVMQKKIPIAYSYNGVVLPKLPEWDRSVYPYAVIRTTYSETTYSLLLLPANSYYFADSIGDIWFGGDEANGYVTGMEARYSKENKAWNALTEKNMAQTKVSGDTFAFKAFWANFDMEYEGTKYLEASEPVPVYE